MVCFLQLRKSISRRQWVIVFPITIPRDEHAWPHKGSAHLLVTIMQVEKFKKIKIKAEYSGTQLQY